MNKQDGNVAVGFFGLLTLIFVFAKLAGWVAWSWWIVLSPIIIQFVLFLVICLVTVAVLMIGKMQQ